MRFLFNYENFDAFVLKLNTSVVFFYCFKSKNELTRKGVYCKRQVGAVDIAIDAGGLGFNYWASQILIQYRRRLARHRCSVYSELCSPGAKPRRWAPPLVTRLGVISRV